MKQSLTFYSLARDARSSVSPHRYHHDTHSHHQAESMTTFCWGTLVGAPEWRKSFYNEVSAAFCWSNRSSKLVTASILIIKQNQWPPFVEALQSGHPPPSYVEAIGQTKLVTASIFIIMIRILIIKQSQRWPFVEALQLGHPPSSSSWYAFSSSRRVNDELLLRQFSWGTRVKKEFLQ